MSTRETTEEPKMELPSGHPQRGFVAPVPDFVDGTEFDEETQELIDKTNEENQAVLDAEHEVAKAEAEAALAEAEPEPAPKATKAKATSES